ncbi:MAG TPA: MmcQ/YjbR family DNA-binding protein [Usitatibacteraceae bacterium]
MKLQQARKYALSLPETNEEPHFEFSSFRVRGKIFATVPPGGLHLHIFVDEDQRAPLIAAEPEGYEALRWGAKVVGVRVTLAQAHAGTVERLLRQSWMRKAPKCLAALFSQDQP